MIEIENKVVNGYYSDNEYLLVDREDDFVTINLTNLEVVEILNKSEIITTSAHFYVLMKQLMETKIENHQNLINNVDKHVRCFK